MSHYSKLLTQAHSVHRDGNKISRQNESYSYKVLVVCKYSIYLKKKKSNVLIGKQSNLP